MEKQNFKIIEINGVKMQIDLREAKVIDQYKVGDNIKVLIKKYSDNYESHIGTIIGFDEFEKMPTIVIAYLKVDYSSASIEFVYLNSASKDIEICPLNEWDLPITKQSVIDKFNVEMDKKVAELQEIEKKRNVFDKLFGKYFEAKTTTNE